MKRRDSHPLFLLLAAGAACAILAPFACSSNTLQNPRTVALGSPTDIVVMSSSAAALPYAYLFIAATDHNQLNVLDLTNPANREFVRAPNPIEALAIPVVDGPRTLARDVGYTATGTPIADGGVIPAGTEFTGRYVYAVNPALPYVSIVGARPEELIELQRLRTAGSVTAISARALGADGPSQLFYATRNGADAQVWKVDVPGAGLAAAALAPVSLLTIPNASVQALLALPLPTVDAPRLLAVATRDAAGNGGRTFLLDTDAPLAAQPALAFPGPVRLLALNPAVEGGAPLAQYIYGALDESSCGGQQTCRGIVAVSSVSGELAHDIQGGPMLPLQQGDALPLAMAIDARMGVPFIKPAVVDGGVVVQPSAPNDQPLDLVGVVTYSNSTIGYFDAKDLISIDDDPSLPYDTLNVLENAAGQAITPALALTGLTLANGATRDENVYVTYQGAVTGLTHLPLDPAAPVPASLPVDPALLAECQPATSNPQACRAQVGDFVELEGGCTAELSVVAVEADRIDVSPAPPGCAGASSFTVRARAGSSRSFVVSGTTSGYMGRYGPTDGTFAAGAPFFHPGKLEEFTGLPGIRFSMVANPPDLQRDDRYHAVVHSGFMPAFITVNNLGTVLGPLPFAYGLATLPTWPNSNPNDTFVSFPSFSVVGEFNPSSVSLGVANPMSLFGIEFGMLY